MMPRTAIKSESNRTAITPAATVTSPIKAKAGQHADQMIEIHRGEDAEIERRNAAADQPVAQQVDRASRAAAIPPTISPTPDQDRQRHATGRGEPALVDRVLEEEPDAHDQDHHAQPQEPRAGHGEFHRIAGRAMLFAHGDPVPDLDQDLLGRDLEPAGLPRGWKLEWRASRRGLAPAVIVSAPPTPAIPQRARAPPDRQPAPKSVGRQAAAALPKRRKTPQRAFQ